MIQLSKRALAELSEIADYTLAMHGPQQADVYMRALAAAIRRLNRFRKLGRVAAVPGYRVLPVGEHLVFYRLDGETTRIVRVLHARQELPRKLR